jgi:hypothetical protein
MTDAPALLRLLQQQGVRFIVIGGAHRRLTVRLDRSKMIPARELADSWAEADKSELLSWPEIGRC